MDVPIRQSEFVGVLRNWFESQRFEDVGLDINTHPCNDPDDDYVIVLDAHFVPTRFECIQVDFSLSSEGFVGVGLDRYERLAKRISKKTVRRRSNYLSGIEPAPMSVRYVLRILEASKNGCFSSSYLCLPYLGIVSGEIALEKRSDCKRYHSEFPFLHSHSRALFRKVLKYEKWS